MTANPHRGETSITLDGATYTLRPDFEAIVAIEEQTGHSVLDLMVQIQEGRMLKTMDIAVIVTEAIKAHGRATNNPTLQAFGTRRIGELIYKEGTLKIASAIPAFLAAAITGGAKPEGNAEAPQASGPTA